jgi:hypothetical protein
MDQEIIDRFRAIDEKLKIIADAVSTHMKTVGDMQTAFGELQQRGRSVFRPPVMSVAIPSWLSMPW